MEPTEHHKQPGWKVALRVLKVALRVLAVAVGFVLTLVLAYIVILMLTAEVGGFTPPYLRILVLAAAEGSGTPSPEYLRAKYLAIGAVFTCLLATLTLIVSDPRLRMPPVVGYIPVVLFALLAAFGVWAGGGPLFGPIFAALSVLAWWLRT